MSDSEIEEIEVETENDLHADLIKIEKDIRQISKEIDVLNQKKKTLINRKDKIKETIAINKSAKLSNKNWDNEGFKWSKELREIAKTKFNITELRPHQLPTMNATMSKTDCILIMPTGGGKSLCFQLPALLSTGITIVVCPLISLMEDQLMALKRKKIEARMLSASMSKSDVTEVMNAMTDPNTKIKLIYVTPERLAKSKRFMAKLQKMHQAGNFARLAIDEVHCCSQWGHDFRPDYKFLGVIRKLFPGTPILGLTATATSRVVQDVQKILDIQGCLILKASFNRPNLFYEVREKPSSNSECVSEIARLLNGEFRGQSGIIYTFSIKDSIELAKDLKEKGIKVAPYHAQLEPDMRSKIHIRWTENEYQVVVATIAFGMGIDKPDVRFIIHHCVSKSMENFYQESGRAGRDDKPAKCILFWRFADLFKQSTMVFTEQTGLANLYGLLNYCIDSTRCRRNIIAEHFSESWNKADCDKKCDNCKNNYTIKTRELKKQGEQILLILTKAASMDQKLTGGKLVDLWMGKGTPNLRVKEAIVSAPKEYLEKLITHLLLDGFLKEDFHFTAYNTYSYILPGPKAEAGISPSSLDIAIRSSEKNNSPSNISKSSAEIPIKKNVNSQKSEGGNLKKRPRYNVSSDSDIEEL